MKYHLDPSTESAIIGAVAVNVHAFDCFHGHLAVEDFSDPMCARLWQKVQAVHRAGLEVNHRTIAERCDRSERDALIVAVSPEGDNGSDSRAWKRWRKIVKDASMLRRVRALGDRLASERDEPLDDLLDEMRRVIEDAEGARGFKEPSHVRSLTQRALERLENRDDEAGLMTGYGVMDEFLNGLKGFIVVGGDASMGKTAGLCNLFAKLHVAGHRPAYLSCEDGEDALIRRMLQAHARFNWQQAARGYYSDAEASRIALDAGRFTEGDAWVLDGLSTVTEICYQARRLVERQSAGVLLIDYLQLAEAEGQHRSEYEAITSVSKTLVRLQKELGVPVIVAAQLNRKREESASLPGLHHLKGSGQIGQDADLVLLLYRESRAAEEMKIIVAKHRNGPTGMLHFTFNGHTQVIAEDGTNAEPGDQTGKYPGADVCPV